ncbi:hypothetical protein [Parolsenella catena]|uniref:hypothetical protein n=1 Tax=Parolsenella catena TaxID=2003188 RepID=UPI002FD9668A
MEQQRHDRHNDGHGEEDRKQDAGGAHAREASGRLVGVCQVRRLLHELHELLEEPIFLERLSMTKVRM